MNNDVFFTNIKRSLFGSFSQSQVDGLNSILAACEILGVTDTRYIAYMLATAYHETNKTMQPIKELGGVSYLTKMYDITGSRPSLAKQNGNTSKGDGVKYAGRGYVQLTWKNNYLKAKLKLGVDLVNNPDLALDKDIAAKIMIYGMTEGWFTGKMLSNFFNDTKSDWKNARKIINGLDKADNIAVYAQKFYLALTLGLK
jgi:predicted chitinase